MFLEVNTSIVWQYFWRAVKPVYRTVNSEDDFGEGKACSDGANFLAISLLLRWAPQPPPRSFSRTRYVPKAKSQVKSHYVYRQWKRKTQTLDTKVVRLKINIWVFPPQQCNLAGVTPRSLADLVDVWVSTEERLHPHLGVLSCMTKVGCIYFKAWIAFLRNPLIPEISASVRHSTRNI